MAKIHVTGKASDTTVMDRVKGNLRLIFKAEDTEASIKAYNDMVSMIKAQIPVSKQDDSEYTLSVGTLSVISSTESVKRLFVNTTEKSVFTQAYITFDCEANEDIGNRLLRICDKNASVKYNKFNSKGIGMNYSISSNAYISDSKLDDVNTALSSKAVENGYKKLKAILEGINKSRYIDIEGTQLSSKVTNIKLESVAKSSGDYGGYLRASSKVKAASLDMMSAEDSRYDIDGLGDNKVKLSIELDMVFEIS